MSTARLRVLSSWLTNLSAGWFGVIFITPALTSGPPISPGDLTMALGWGIITFELAVQLEGVLGS